MKKVLIALLSFSLAQVSWGQLVSFVGTMDGAQSNTPSPATGWLKGTIDLGTNFFVLDYGFSGLLAPQTAAHVHLGAPGVNGPVVIGAPSFQLGELIHFEGFISDTTETNLLAGNLYLNIHSTLYRGGEIRGQLMPVPEPSTYALVGAGLLGGVILLRRRKQQALAAR
jgi:hypothetical protein